MIALVLAVFSASLLGSLHCAGMCGAFVACAIGIDQKPNAARSAWLQASYHVGRLVTYVMLGASAGSVGAAFDLGGRAVGLQRVAVAIAGASMVVFGVLAILRLNGVRLPSAPAPAFLRRAAESVLRSAMRRPPAWRAAIIGLSTTFLPCGWLYAFVLTSAGSGSAAHGAIIMAVFWVGTLPVLIALGAGMQAAFARLGALGARIPLLSATMIVCVGLFSVFDRGRIDAALAAAMAQPTGASTIERVRSIGVLEKACCDERPDLH